MKGRQAQSWSMDVVLAVVIFGFISVAFTSFALLERPDVSSLQREAQQVSNSLSSPLALCNNFPVLEGGTMQRNATICLFNQSYDDLRAAFRTRQNFCIFLEDSNGQLIPIRVNSTHNRYTVGSNQVTVGGQRCGDY